MKKLLLLPLVFYFLPVQSQNVGIGTSVPETKLHIRDSVNGIANMLKLQNASPYISFHDNSNNYKSYIWETGGGLQIGTAATGSSITIAPEFNIRTTFFPNGNVGIGTPTADARLHIDAGSANELLRMNSTGYPFMSFHKSGLQKAFLGLVQGDGFLTQDHLQLSTSSLSNLPLEFHTNGLSRMSISGNGEIVMGGAGNPVSLDVNGYTRLGNPGSSPRIQIIKLVGTTAATQGGISQILHGIANVTKIIGINVLVQNPSGEYIPPNHTDIIGREFNFLITSNHVEVFNDSVNSSVILNRPVKILITLED